MLDVHPLWDRRMKVSDGHYWAVKCPDHPFAWKNGYVYEHRLVLELKLGRFLQSGEVAHHKDENGLNNTPSNLVVKTRAKHSSEHRPERKMFEAPCARCGAKVVRTWNNRPEVKGYSDVFCSRRCNGAAQREKQLQAPVV